MEPRLGQVVSRQRETPAGRALLRIHRGSGPVEERPLDVDLERAKVIAHGIHADDPDVYRVDIRDPFSTVDIWSTDDAWR